MRVSSTPNSIALSGAAVSAITRPIRIVDARLPPAIAEPSAAFSIVSLGGEGLGRDRDQGRVRIEAGDRLLERGAVDIGDDRRLVAAGVAAERVDQQLRARAPSRRCRYGGCGAPARTPRPRSRRSGRACGRGGRRRGRRSPGAPCPRSAVCSAARPSVGLTISPANIASRRAARPASLGELRGRRRACSRLRWVLEKSKRMPRFLERQPRQPVGLGREQVARASAARRRLVQALGPGVRSGHARAARLYRTCGRASKCLA